MNFNKKAFEGALLAVALVVIMAVAHTDVIDAKGLISSNVTAELSSAVARGMQEDSILGTAGVSADLSDAILIDEALVADATASIEALKASQVAEAEEPELVEEVIPEEWQNRVMVNTNVDKYVNVREEASTEASVLGKLYRGSVATIVERGDEWTKITSGKVEGYVYSEYLAFGNDAKTIAEEEGTWIVTSTAGGLRVREEPNAESSIVSALSEGQELRWDVDAETEDGWVAVIFKNRTCYVSAEYVEVDLDLGEAISIEEERAALAAAAAQNREATRTQGEAVASSYDDVTLLAALIWCEGGNQGDEGRLAIGAVVVNRVWSAGYPNTVKDVIYQRGQFGPASNGRLATVLANGSYSQACVTAAEQALSGITNVGGALHFGRANGRSGIVIGAHVFY